MKKFAILLTTLFVLVLGAPQSSAGNLSTPNATLNWDDSNFYIPTSCSQFTFQVRVDSSVLMADITITNKYGDKLGSTLTFATGTPNVQICALYEFIDTNVTFEVTKSGGGGTTTVKAPITFKSRSSSSSASATPAATPTITVTAQPQPAPTITVTAQPQPAQTIYVDSPVNISMQTKIESLQAQLNSVSNKLKKICALKPKPKGC